MAIDANKVSSLLDNLPAVFQEDRTNGAPNFLGRFLLGFEQLLLGLGDAAKPGLEETIARIYRYFEPGAPQDPTANGHPDECAPPEFLKWLASWVALTLREDWEEPRQREMIAEAASLYRRRGTKRGVEDFLSLYTRLGAEIDELSTPFQIGVHSRVGRDTILDGGAPFFFRVHVFLPDPDPVQMKAQQEIAQSIVDLQKPAHTYYKLTVETPTLQINVHSKVGVDTLLG